jgi:predicted Zn-dependent protease
MPAAAKYFDGECPVERVVEVSLDGSAITLSRGRTAPQSWPLARIRSVSLRDQEGMRIAYDGLPNARLIVSDEKLQRALLAVAAHLSPGMSGRELAQMAGAFVVGISGLVLLLFVIVQLLPDQIASVLPEPIRANMGARADAAVSSYYRLCNSAAGEAALRALVARITANRPDAVPSSILVYDIPEINAFALPGGHVVVNSGLIGSASSPGEVAGVIAHEMGHVYYRHPEASIIREIGIQLLINAATGSNDNAFSSIAARATMMRYSRHYERQADSFGLGLLNDAEIDPMDMKRFFQTLIAANGSGPRGPLERIFATHPGTDERIARIEPLPVGKVPRPVLTIEQWLALKGTCKT